MRKIIDLVWQEKWDKLASNCELMSTNPTQNKHLTLERFYILSLWSPAPEKCKSKLTVWQVPVIMIKNVSNWRIIYMTFLPFKGPQSWCHCSKYLILPRAKCHSEEAGTYMCSSLNVSLKSVWSWVWDFPLQLCGSTSQSSCVQGTGIFHTCQRHMTHTHRLTHKRAPANNMRELVYNTPPLFVEAVIDPSYYRPLATWLDAGQAKWFLHQWEIIISQGPAMLMPLLSNFDKRHCTFVNQFLDPKLPFELTLGATG